MLSSLVTQIGIKHALFGAFYGPRSALLCSQTGLVLSAGSGFSVENSETILLDYMLTWSDF